MEQKSIFITGAASGIGRATAIYFSNKGWFVGSYDVDADALSELQQELGDGCISSCLDVRDKEEVAVTGKSLRSVNAPGRSIA